MSKIFINEFGRLRSGWRLVVFVLALIAVWLILATALQGVYLLLLTIAPQLPFLRFIDKVSSLGATLGAGYLCARFLEDLPWKSLGLTIHTGWLRDLVVGSAIGFAAVVVAVAIAAGGGGLRFSFNDAATFSIGRSMLGSAVLLFVAALAEEALFRGYPLQTLTRAKLAALGILLTSVPFGIAHLSNPNVVPGVTFVNTVLAGLWLAVAYLRTRSLWFPLGVHWSWNWAFAWFFGLPVSGLNLTSNPLLQASDEGPAWLTGGPYGVEGGLTGTIAMVLFTVFVWRTSWITATPELKQLTSQENPAVPSPVISIRPVDDDA